MLRLIALYLHYRELQEERSRSGTRAAAPMMRLVNGSAVHADDERDIRALAA